MALYYIIVIFFHVCFNSSLIVRTLGRSSVAIGMGFFILFLSSTHNDASIVSLLKQTTNHTDDHRLGITVLSRLTADKGLCGLGNRRIPGEGPSLFSFSKRFCGRLCRRKTRMNLCKLTYVYRQDAGVGSTGWISSAGWGMELGESTVWVNEISHVCNAGGIIRDIHW